MKLRNKKTGEVGEFFCSGDPCMGEITLGVEFENEETVKYNSLSKMAEEWEDYEEPKDDYIRVIESFIHYVEEADDSFCCDETVQKFCEKLKAWKRLKDKGFKFEGIKEDYTRILQSQEPFRTGKRYLQFNKSEDEEWMEENWKDLDILFGDGE